MIKVKILRKNKQVYFSIFQELSRAEKNQAAIV